MTNPVRVLHVLGELRPSGAEVMLRVAAPYFRRMNFRIEVLSTGEKVGEFAQDLEQAGIAIHHVPFSRSWRFVAAIHAFLRAGRFDVIHQHTDRASFCICLAALAAGSKRIVRTVHNNFTFGGALRVRRLLQRMLARKLGVKFVAISPSVQETERRNFWAESVLILNWYDSARFRPPGGEERASARRKLNLSEHEFAVAVVGNCSRVKNHQELIRAVAAMAPGCPVRLLHAGTEETDFPERRLAHELGIADRVSFLGPVRDVAQVLHAADAFVMPSLFEGLGIAALEALAVGLPSVFSDCPGLRDLRQFVPGVWYATPDAEGLRQRLMEVMALDQDHRVALGRQQATAVTETFGVERGVRLYAQVYSGDRN